MPMNHQISCSFALIADSFQHKILGAIKFIESDILNVEVGEVFLAARSSGKGELPIRNSLYEKQ